MPGRSRYEGLPTSTVEVEDGRGGIREVVFLLTRTPLDPALAQPLAWHRVTADDRLDLRRRPLPRRPGRLLADLRRQPRPRPGRAGGPGCRGGRPRRPDPGGLTVSALGIRLSVLAGPTVPVPLPADTTARLRSVQVTETDEERSVFTLTLDAGRSGPSGALDSPLLTGSPLGVGARVVVVVAAGVVPTILMDGIVTTVELMPERRAGRRHAQGDR